MGPLATAEFLRRVVLSTPANGDQEHVPLIVYSNPQVPDRTAAILEGGESPVPTLVASARVLEAAGAEFIAMPCVTAHCFFDEIQQHVGIEILHLIREMLAEVARTYRGVRRLGLMATTGTVATGLVQTHFGKAGCDVLTPADGIQQGCVMEAIYGRHGLKAVGPNRHARRALQSAAAHLIHRGAEMILLGCTEIPMGLAGVRLPVPVVDSLDVLARAVVREACAKNSPMPDPRQGIR